MPQTSSNQDNKAYALLIGVDSYKSFDGTGTSDLKGSRNDVFLLASYCVEVLGMRPENIAALITPELTPEERKEKESLRGINWGDATEKEVTKRLAWLLDVSKGVKALLAFSGHGAALPGGEPVLCLGDTAPGLTSGVLSLKTLRHDIKNAYADGRLVALLDCCHVASRSPHQRLRGTSLSHAVAAADVAGKEDLFRVSDRVLLAARPGELAYQVRLGTGWHGALTFALVTAAERWQGENEVSHGSYKHVLKRAKGTLKALGVPQKSELRVPAVERAAIRKQPFLAVNDGATQRKPDAVGLSAQLDGGYRYLFQAKDASGNPPLDLAVVLASGATTTQITLGNNPAWPGEGHDDGYEAWYVNSNTVQKLGSGYTVVVTKQPVSPSELVAVMSTGESASGFAGLGGTLNRSNHYFSANEVTAAGWTRTPPVVVRPPIYFRGQSADGTPLWMAWDWEGISGLVQVIWYVISDTQPTAPIKLADSTSFTFQSNAPEVGTYFQCPSSSFV